MKTVTIQSDRELDVMVAEQFGWQGPVLWLDEEDSPVDRPTDQHPADPYMFPPGIVSSDDRAGDQRVPHFHEHPYWNLLGEEMSSRGFRPTVLSLDHGYLAAVAVSFDDIHVVRGYNKDRILTQCFLLTRGIDTTHVAKTTDADPALADRARPAPDHWPEPGEPDTRPCIHLCIDNGCACANSPHNDKRCILPEPCPDQLAPANAQDERETDVDDD